MYNKLGLLLQWRLAQWNPRNVNYLTNSFVLNTISCSSRPAVLGKKAAQKNFAKIYTVKHLWWSFFLTKLQAWELFSCEFCKMFKNNYFDGHLQMAASGMTWKKKQSPIHPNQVKQSPQYGDLAKNNTFLTEYLPVVASE